MKAARYIRENTCAGIHVEDIMRVVPLATIADRSGFAHPEYFSVAFKRINRTTASEYRRRVRGGR